MYNSRILTIKDAKFSGYYFYISLNILEDFQICISVPLNKFADVVRKFMFLYSFSLTSNLKAVNYHRKILYLRYSTGLWIHHFAWLLRCAKSVRIRSFSSPYFPAFRKNTERCSVPLRSQSEYGEMQTRKTPNTDTFHVVVLLILVKIHRFNISNIFTSNLIHEYLLTWWV